MEFSDMREKVCCCLECLFEEWFEKQKNETVDSAKKTFPIKTKEKIRPDYQYFSSSFCPDGYSSLAGDVQPSEQPKIEVLFVLKESHLEENEKGELQPEIKGTFWFNELINDNTRKKYGCGIRDVLIKLKEKSRIEGDISDDLRFGYMNINKRGGYGSTNMTQLKNYAEEYGELIRRQIDIMHPKIIVCMGCYGIVRDTVFKGEKTSYQILDFYHPSYSGFKKKLKNSNDRDTNYEKNR